MPDAAGRARSRSGARYGAPGSRTFHQQIAANQGSSILLVAVLFEIMAMTGFLIGATIGLGVRDRRWCGGLVVARDLDAGHARGDRVRAGSRGDGFVLDVSRARRRPGPKEQQLRNVVAELCDGRRDPGAQGLRDRVQRPATRSRSGRDPEHGTIAVTRGPPRPLDREELQGVIAHELAHIANLDSRHAVLVALLVGAIVLLTDVFFRIIIEIAQNPWTGDDLRTRRRRSRSGWSS